MKKFFKFLGILLVVLIVAGTVFYFVKNEDLPQGKQGVEADALATKMFNAINHKAFETTEIIEWDFRNAHFYKWYKHKSIVEVSWDENKVILNTKEPKKSEVFVNDKKVDNPELIQTAESYFNNDSFWLIAPYKIFDAGTKRSIVNYENKEALMITYTSGGSTPGDSYLWFLDDNYMPTSFKMWTKVIPIGGVSATWSNFKNTKSGIKLPTNHTRSLFGLEIPINNANTNNPPIVTIKLTVRGTNSDGASACAPGSTTYVQLVHAASLIVP